MPEDSQDENEQKPQSTPHFDAFSGRDDEEEAEPSRDSFAKDNLASETSTSMPEILAFAPEEEPVEGPDVYPVQPEPESDVIQPSQGITISTVQKPKKGKKLIIGIIAAILVVLIAGGSVFAFNSYYQNPQKVITDSIINAVTAKSAIYTGNLTVDSNGSKVTLDIIEKNIAAIGSLDAKLNISYGGKSFKISGGAIVDKSGDIYFKLSDLSALVAEAKTSLGVDPSTKFSASIDNLVKKIDGVWVKISSDNLKQYSAEASTSKTCVNNAITKFKNDNKSINEVADVYRANAFIVLEKDLGQKDGSLGYQITSKNVKLKAFLEGLKSTATYKSLHSCDKNFVIDTAGMPTTDEKSVSTVQLWSNFWTHKMTKIVISSDSDGTKVNSTTNVKYDQTFSITAPSSSISLTTLKSYIDEALTDSGMMGNSL